MKRHRLLCLLSGHQWDLTTVPVTTTAPTVALDAEDATLMKDIPSLNAAKELAQRLYEVLGK